MKEIDRSQSALWRRCRRIALILFALAITVGMNLIVEDLAKKRDWNLDFSANNRFSISEETKQLVSSLSSPVRVYSLFSTGAQTSSVLLTQEILNHYTSYGTIRVQNIDMVRNPAAVERFRTEGRTIANGSLIVANQDESRFRVITAGEMFDYELNAEMNGYSRVDFVGEQKLDAAIVYVTSQVTPRVLFLQGHGETDYAALSNVRSAVEANNYETLPLSLSSEQVKLRPDDILLVIEPKQDLTAEEYEIVKNHLSAGGKMYFAASYGTEGLTAFEALMQLYGLSMDDRLVMEDTASVAYYYRNPLYLMPQIHNDALENAGPAAGFSKGDYVVLPQSRAISRIASHPLGLDRTQVLSTSDTAYSISGIEETDGERESFQLAWAAEKIQDNREAGRIFVVGNGLFLTHNELFSAYSNRKLLLSPLSWLSGQPMVQYAEGKSMGAYRLNIPDNTVYRVVSIAVVGGLPLLMLIIGLTVWHKRRRRS